MEKATQATTPTAPPEPTYAGDVTFAHAAAVAASVVDPLTPDARPSSVRIEPMLPAGWAVTIIFLSHRAAGVYEVAANVDTVITRAFHDDEIHLEAYARLYNVDVRAAVLVTQKQAAELEGQPVPLSPTTEASTEPTAPQPIPLGASVLAHVPAVTPVQPVNTAVLDVEDVARCVRCGCTEDAACEGGCCWVPNAQMVDLCSACATPEELQAMTYTTEVSDGGE